MVKDLPGPVQHKHDKYNITGIVSKIKLIFKEILGIHANPPNYKLIGPFLLQSSAWSSAYIVSLHPPTPPLMYTLVSVLQLEAQCVPAKTISKSLDRIISVSTNIILTLVGESAFVSLENLVERVRGWPLLFVILGPAVRVRIGCAMGHPVFTVSGARCNYWPGLARTRQEKSEIKNVTVDYALRANGSYGTCYSRSGQSRSECLRPWELT